MCTQLGVGCGEVLGVLVVLDVDDTDRAGQLNTLSLANLGNLGGVAQQDQVAEVAACNDFGCTQDTHVVTLGQDHGAAVCACGLDEVVQEAQRGHGSRALDGQAGQQLVLVDVLVPATQGGGQLALVTALEGAVHAGDGACGLEGVVLGGQHREGCVLDELAHGGVLAGNVVQAAGEQHARGSGEGRCQCGGQGCGHDVCTVAGDNHEVAVDELAQEVGDGHGGDLDAVNIAAEVLSLHAGGVELEGLGHLTDGRSGQLGNLGQHVDGQVCLAALDGLLDVLAQGGLRTVDDDGEQVSLGCGQLGAGHVNGGDCLFDGGFLRTDDGDDGQAQVACNLDVQVEFDCECVGGQVGAVNNHDVAVGCDLLVGGYRAGGNLFGVALSDECECVVHGDGAADLLLGEVEVLANQACYGVVSDGCAVEDGAEEADAVRALNQGVCQAQGNQGLARVRGRSGEVKTGGHILLSFGGVAFGAGTARAQGFPVSVRCASSVGHFLC